MAKKPRPKMTYEVARAAAYDAATRNMRDHGRTKWNEEDYNFAAKTFNRLCPEDSECEEEHRNRDVR